ncbi:hypothetical protein GNI_130840 [Gregarina niphandrodes]|uniref:Uncharacterized protein n=1 Tax=Gregarina niphandrodes TaxID=110365 RepID=A0A023B1G1_GRENI|nr:hypothetical protein GNI_130840 [Gregarina niphandrodes]EZG47658.1 hypothetical protein GNI_130840 [Gregarina niphandrodes]|eukprot:XP_011132160.1 hypothetical protein GNI_130840 [Gregarina niphandrodes]
MRPSRADRMMVCDGSLGGFDKGGLVASIRVAEPWNQVSPGYYGLNTMRHVGPMQSQNSLGSMKSMDKSSMKYFLADSLTSLPRDVSPPRDQSKVKKGFWKSTMELFKRPGPERPERARSRSAGNLLSKEPPRRGRSLERSPAKRRSKLFLVNDTEQRSEAGSEFGSPDRESKKRNSILGRLLKVGRRRSQAEERRISPDVEWKKGPRSKYWISSNKRFARSEEELGSVSPEVLPFDETAHRRDPDNSWVYSGGRGELDEPSVKLRTKWGSGGINSRELEFRNPESGNFNDPRWEKKPSTFTNGIDRHGIDRHVNRHDKPYPVPRPDSRNPAEWRPPKHRKPAALPRPTHLSRKLRPAGL